MEFRVLGALEAGAGTAVADLGPPKQRALLAILVLHVGEIVSVDRLTDLLWGDDPPRTAAHSIQIYVSELRKALEPIAGSRLIHTRGPGYRLEAPADQVDARRFEALVAQGMAQLQDGEHAGAIVSLRAALELWRGPALSDFAYDEFAQPYVQRFHDLHLDAVEALAGAELASGQSGRVVPLLEAAIRDDPLRERSRELLMLALYRSGRHPEALRTYDRFRELLVEELGLEPSPPLQRLRDRVLLHDPTLAPQEPDERAGGRTRNPYKGLQAFGEQDAQDFFGREALVERLVAAIGAGQRLLALVGPSGSGKSSVVAAGLVPRLRAGVVPGSERWTIVSLALGPDPAADVRTAVGHAAKASLGSTDGLPTSVNGRPLVLVIDGFEQLFTAADEARRTQFLSRLAAALADPASQLVVILTLRADYYDRPLQHPEFGEVFVPGVVHVLPMSARELEAAIVTPAEGVGVRVEPALLAELVAETVARPGSLPLLQFALTELFEGRSGPEVTHAGYAALGGLRGVLSRRAEAAFLGLGAEEQRVAIQLFLRLVRLGRGTADSRGRLTLAEVTDLGTDAVALSEVLTTFGRHRLLTFDHDPVTGQATVELAHEALLTEWERLAGWIDRHRSALRRRDALVAAVDEWELSGRDPEYLLGGGRLAELDAWSREGSLDLTSREREYLDAGLALERRATEAETARTEEHRRLARTARLRLIGLSVAVVVLVAGSAFWVVAGQRRGVALLFTHPGLVAVQITGGFDRAVRDFGLTSRKYSWEGVWAALEAKHGTGWDVGIPEEEVFALLDAEIDAQLREAASDAGMIALIEVPAFLSDAVAADFPDVQFLSDQPSDLPNVTILRFDDSQASYLAGAAAAMTTQTGIIGYIGGVDWEGIWGFQSGYEAGARAVDPSITILSEYLSGADTFDGFGDPAAAEATATEMYEDGADIVMHAAGDSGLGLFDAAVTFTEATGRHVWAIGVDSDQYYTTVDLPGARNAEAWQDHILTSVLKGLDDLTYAAIGAYVDGTFEPGIWTWGLETGAAGLSYSGGYLDELRDELEALEAQIIAGEIRVPCIPDDHRDQAEAMGIGPDYCRESTHRADVEQP
ncbi:MAG TPA: BTAD domain-containing putative transcriptional regulator [Patescibacteria group bacterium]|nr:BTAD domain-containing putative transcriptional regulator [Patescibacteria group bacterium]